MFTYRVLALHSDTARCEPTFVEILRETRQNANNNIAHAEMTIGIISAFAAHDTDSRPDAVKSQPLHCAGIAEGCARTALHG